MKLLVWAYYYNNEWYLKYQIDSLNKHLKCGYHMVVFNDAKDDTVSLFSGKPARKAIHNECEKYGVEHILIPQDLHKSPNPSMRHIDCLNFSQKTYNTAGYGQLLTLDSDVFLYGSFSPTDHIKYSLVGPRQVSGVSPLPDDETPQKLGPTHNTDIFYPHVGFLLINLELVEISALNFNLQSGVYTDTGSGLHDYIVANPDEHYYLYDEVNVGGWSGYEVWDNVAIHMREGTNHAGLPHSRYFKERIVNYQSLYEKLNGGLKLPQA